MTFSFSRALNCTTRCMAFSTIMSICFASSRSPAVHGGFTYLPARARRAAGSNHAGLSERRAGQRPLTSAALVVPMLAEDLFPLLLCGVEHAIEDIRECIQDL